LLAVRVHADAVEQGVVDAFGHGEPQRVRGRSRLEPLANDRAPRAGAGTPGAPRAEPPRQHRTFLVGARGRTQLEEPGSALTCGNRTTRHGDEVLPPAATAVKRWSGAPRYMDDDFETVAWKTACWPFSLTTTVTS